MSIGIKAARETSQGAGPAEMAGDPGLFGFLGSAVKGVAKVGLGLAGIQLGGSPSVTRATQFVQQAPPQRGVPAQGPFRSAVARALPFGMTGEERVACPSGYHPNKSDYFLKSGEFVAAGSRCVKNRKRNPLNPRAASRAMSRLESGKKAMGVFNRFSIRKKKCN